jgi:OmpA-OmpF porin, OOP family
VRNAVDRAPTQPEDVDRFQDDDGMPAPDNDGDQTPDAVDACPEVPGPAENQGCADRDADGDGVIDRLDACPASAEDADGVQDNDGCPEVEDDGAVAPP